MVFNVCNLRLLSTWCDNLYDSFLLFQCDGISLLLYTWLVHILMKSVKQRHGQREELALCHVNEICYDRAAWGTQHSVLTMKLSATLTWPRALLCEPGGQQTFLPSKPPRLHSVWNGWIFLCLEMNLVHYIHRQDNYTLLKLGLKYMDLYGDFRQMCIYFLISIILLYRILL